MVNIDLKIDDKIGKLKAQLSITVLFRQSTLRTRIVRTPSLQRLNRVMTAVDAEVVLEMGGIDIMGMPR